MDTFLIAVVGGVAGGLIAIPIGMTIERTMGAIRYWRLTGRWSW